MTRILIVDDHPENVYFLRALLTAHGFAVEEAANGAEALGKAAIAPPDLVISDLLMPVVDGYSLLRRWRADATLRTVPFIVFTATYTTPRDERLAMAMGADAFLIKPAEPDAILGCVCDVQARQRDGLLPSMKGRTTGELELLQEYNEVLLHKIEQKVVEVERANEDLRREVAERKRVQEELRESGARFLATFEQTAIGIAHVDINGRFIWANRKLCEMCGYGPGELAGLSFSIMTHPDWREEAEAARRAMLAGVLASYEAEKRYLRKDGSSFWGSLVATLVRDEAGRPDRFISVISDVTGRKAVEEVLRQRDRAIQAVSQGITITDPSRPDNPITYASQGFERMTGFSEAEVLGRNCRFLQGEGTDPGQVARLREAIAAARPVEVEILNYRKDGTPFWNLVSINPVRDDSGDLAYFVGVQSDVTARKRLESDLLQMQKMEAVGQLAGGIAHDFNNHLTVIGGYSDEILATPGLPPMIREAVTAISEAGQRAASLTRQLLGFSRQTMLQPRVIDLNGAVLAVARMLRRLISAHVRLDLVRAPDARAVLVDAVQLDQVLINLAVNARDAMPEGGRLTIETTNVTLGPDYCATHLDSRPGDYVMLAVSDTGTGMTPEVRARIFEPFFTTKGVGKGTGLGLPTVLGIVQQSQGSIQVYSEPGIGTTFKIYLPAAESLAPVPDLVAPSIVPSGQETLLLVEDDENVRRLAQMALTRHGYRVLVARHGVEALTMIEAQEPRIDLVVTDVVMPEMSGPELVRRLRTRLPQLRALFMSGYTDDAVVRHGLLDATVAFIQKPYSGDALASKVRETLKAGGMQRVGQAGGE